MTISMALMSIIFTGYRLNLHIAEFHQGSPTTPITSSREIRDCQEEYTLSNLQRKTTFRFCLVYEGISYNQ